MAERIRSLFTNFRELCRLVADLHQAISQYCAGVSVSGAHQTSVHDDGNCSLVIPWQWHLFGISGICFLLAPLFTNFPLQISHVHLLLITSGQ
jgi:hypothetical protein